MHEFLNISILNLISGLNAECMYEIKDKWRVMENADVAFRLHLLIPLLTLGAV